MNDEVTIEFSSRPRLRDVAAAERDIWINLSEFDDPLGPPSKVIVRGNNTHRRRSRAVSVKVGEIMEEIKAEKPSRTRDENPFASKPRGLPS